MAAALAVGALLQASPAPREPPASGSAERLLVGELTKIDLGQRVVALRVGDKDPQEIEIVVDPETRIVSRGRVLRLEDLRPGDPAKVLCVDKGGRHRARVLKTGASRYAASVPSPRP